MNEWGELDLALDGNRQAWDRLVQRHAARLVRLAGMISGSPDVAEDVVQETFIELFRKPPGHRRGSLAAWLTTVAFHLTLKEKKRQERWTRLDTTDPADEEPLPLARVLSSDLQRRILRSVHSLDQVHRDVMILRFYGECSLQEIAGILEVPLGTVKSRLFNAVKRCRMLLLEKGITP